MIKIISGKIKNIILNETLSIRDKTLLENLINNMSSNDMIINEYLLNNDITFVINFINIQCPDSITKTKFSKLVIEKYINNSSDVLLNLLKLLISNNVIFKCDVINSVKLIKDLDKDLESIIIKYYN